MSTLLLRFTVKGRPRAQKHEAGRKGGGRRTDPETREYMHRAGWDATQAVQKSARRWPTKAEVYMDLYIYYLREKPRADPENVMAVLQDAFTSILWWNDAEVLGRAQRTWWPGKNTTPPPSEVCEKGRYVGGVIVEVWTVEEAASC